MLVLVALAFPGVLLLLLLAMDRVEAPLRTDDVRDDLVLALDAARPDDLERLVAQGLGTAVDRFWRRRFARGTAVARRLARN